MTDRPGGTGARGGARPERDPDRESPSRRRRPDRVGELLPEAARRLGLESELRLARAIATWDALIAERVPAAVGLSRLVEIEADGIVVAVEEPIAATELRTRALELLEAFRAAPGGSRARQLRLVGARGREGDGSGDVRGRRV